MIALPKITLQDSARLAEAVYRDAGQASHEFARTVAVRFAKLGLDSATLIDRDDTQAVVGKMHGRVVVVFRGTERERIDDIVTDLRCMPRATPAGCAHTGFALALDSVWVAIAREIERQKPITADGTDRYIHWCGHSLGGALAVVAASRMLANTDTVHTFGAPAALGPIASRVVDQVMRKRITRVERFDIVTMVLSAFYRKVGRLTYIDRRGVIYERTGWHVTTRDRIGSILLSCWSAIAETIRRRRPSLHIPHVIDNHSMTRYRELIEQGTHH